MRTSSEIAVVGAIVIAGVASTPYTRVAVQATYQFQYAAKVVCGKWDRTTPVVPQTYATSINVNNPSDSLTASFRKWFVMTFPEGGQIPQRPMKEMRDTLLQRWALMSDCRDIVRRNGISVPFFEGFLVIQSTLPLDVTGVYTVPGGIDVVTLNERRIYVGK